VVKSETRIQDENQQINILFVTHKARLKCIGKSYENIQNEKNVDEI
jgi:broad specificity phosphatase PhoE